MMLGEEEDMSSECSSGCQSGWTMYLDQSYYEAAGDLACKKGGGGGSIQQEEEEEEDLSMVSDASSGPPHFHEEDEHCYCYHQCSTYCCQGNGCLCSALTPAAATAAIAKDCGKKRRVKEAEQQKQHSSLLDDTASSPVFSNSKANFSENTSNIKPSVDDLMEFSCGFSATHFKGKSAMQKQMPYLEASVPVKPTPTRPVSRKESGKKMW